MRTTALGFLVAFGFCSAAQSARAQAPYSMHVGGWPQNITREVCAHKAIAAMAIMGGKPDQAVAAFLVPGPNAVSINIGVLAVSPSDETSRKVSRALCKEIVKLIYD